MKFRYIALLALPALFMSAVPAAADPITLGTAVLTVLGTDGAAVAASALLTTVAAVVGEVALVGASIGLPYLAAAISGPRRVGS